MFRWNRQCNYSTEHLGRLTVLIAASQAGKISSVQTDLRQAYAILQREVAEYEKDKRELAALKIQVKAAEKPDKESEVTDG